MTKMNKINVQVLEQVTGGMERSALESMKSKTSADPREFMMIRNPAANDVKSEIGKLYKGTENIPENELMIGFAQASSTRKSGLANYILKEKA